jgi:hypothetical protein
MNRNKDNVEYFFAIDYSLHVFSNCDVCTSDDKYNKQRNRSRKHTIW